MKHVMGVFVLVWLVVPAADWAWSQTSSTAAEIAELRKRLEALERKLTQDEQERQALRQQVTEGQKQREHLNKELEEKTKTLAQEVEFAKLGSLLPEKAALKSEYGLGPAASGVYKVKQGLSLGAYGEANYRKVAKNKSGRNDQADFLRLVTYLGYKFNDHILFNSEVEFEHGTTDGIGGSGGSSAGEVSVEFAYLDFLYRPEMNGRLGLMLAPIGFINEIHEPPYFFGVARPETARVIIPTTWRPLGFGIFGDLTDEISYRTYSVNTLRASRFNADEAIREGRQSGNRVLANDWGWMGRLDYAPRWLPGLDVGGSIFLGNTGQNETFTNSVSGTKSKPEVFTKLWEIHAEYIYRQLELRALGAWGWINNAGTLSLAQDPGEDPVPSGFYGFYVELGYDILPFFRPETTQYFAPFFRYEHVNTQWRVPAGFKANEGLNKDIYTVGFSYKPIPNVVLKMDYRQFEASGSENSPGELAVGMGFAF